MFAFIEKLIIGLLKVSGSLVRMTNFSNFEKCISLINQPCISRPAVVNLNPYEYNQKRWYYSFIVNLNRS